MFFLYCSLDLTENLAENLTKDDKTSIKDGLSKLLEIFKDEDKDTVAPKNVNSGKQIDAEELLEEEAGSKEGTGNRPKQFNNPSRFIIIFKLLLIFQTIKPFFLFKT